jgi:hypothetical protein
MPQDDGQPDLRYAGDWLKQVAARLRERDEVFVTVARHVADDEATDAQNLGRIGDALGELPRVDGRDDAATLLSVANRGQIIDRYSQVPTVAQLNVVANRCTNGSEVAVVWVRPFDLPPDYLLVQYTDGFVCGIAPNGDVSS